MVADFNIYLIKSNPPANLMIISYEWSKRSQFKPVIDEPTKLEGTEQYDFFLK
jgi:hypothetical protein